MQKNPNFSTNKVYRFLRTPVEAITYDMFLSKIDMWLGEKKSNSSHVALINAYCATLAFQDNRISRIYNEADLIVPDGMPFVYWLRFILKRPCDQLDATNILRKLAQHAKHKNYSFYLYGGHLPVLEQMKCNLEAQYPHINIVGYKSPPFRKLSEIEDKTICDEINQLNPDIICIGLGTPKQDYWIYDHKKKIKGAIMVPCGAIFDFFGGRISKAPDIVSKSGFEWLYRLCSKDFKRLLKRYTVINAIFLWHFFLQLITNKVIR